MVVLTKYYSKLNSHKKISLAGLSHGWPHIILVGSLPEETLLYTNVGRMWLASTPFLSVSPSPLIHREAPSIHCLCMLYVVKLAMM